MPQEKRPLIASYKRSYAKYLIIAIILLCSFLPDFKVKAQCPGEDIIENHTGNCLPALVRFVVSPALPKGTIYYWDAGDGKGQILGGDTFYHQYTAGGSYGITVYITQAGGVKCTISKPAGFLVFYAASSLGFYADQTLFCAIPAKVNLHDSSGNTIGRDWYINGALYSDHSKDISLTYNSSQDLSVTLVVYNQGGCPQLVEKDNYIHINNIQPAFCSILTENAAHNQISATFKPGFDTTGYDIDEIDWNFPGGSPSSYTGYNPPVISYGNISTPQTVTLTVKTRTGCTGTFTKTDLVRKYYSIVNANVCQKDYARFQYLNTNAPGQNPGFSFIGSDLKISSRQSDGSFNYSLKFGATGKADMKFGINYNFSNCTDSLLVPDMFTILPGKADFTSPDPNQCKAPAKVHLQALNSNSPTGSNSFSWMIFDSLGNPVAGSAIGPTSDSDTSFVILKPGLYSVRLITSNTNGCTDTSLKSGFLRIGVPDNNFSLSTNSLCEGDTLYMKNLGKTPDNVSNPLGYNWVFQLQSNPSITVSATQRDPKIVFFYPGVYDLSYTVSSYSNLCPNTKTIKSAVNVQGVAANVTVSGPGGCVPMTKTLTANILANIPAGPLTYSWVVLPVAGVTIQNPTASTTNVKITEPGCYDVILTIKTNFGCTAVITNYKLICTGTKAAFNVPSQSCRNTPLNIINTSTLNPDAFKWTISPSAGVTIVYDTSQNPKIRISQPGCYKITLQTSKASEPNCFDTVSHLVCIPAPPLLLNVYSPDTSSHCAPRFDQFFASAMYAKNFYWDFGDGTMTTEPDSQPKHAYFKNNNAGYTVRVVALDSNGCPSDTTILKNYIKIAGPEPAFSITTKPPCNGGVIGFLDKSQYVYKYYFLYGDNSGVDSNQIKAHFYKFIDFSKDSNTYIPTLFAYDESGCVETASDTVILYRPSVAGFVTADTFGCVPYAVHFTDTTKYASSYLWNFGDSSTDTTAQPVHIYTNPSPSGNPYKVTLQVLTDKGCSSSAMPLYISVNPLPVIKMTTIAPGYICYQDSVHFKATSDIPLNQYHWKFGDGNLTSDTSSLASPYYHYKNPGRHTVSLIGFSIAGCRDSIADTSIVTLDSLPLAIPQIYYVTVTSTNTIAVVFKEERAPIFYSYTLYRYPGPTAFYNTTYNADTFVQDIPPQINVNTQSYGYTVTSHDQCGKTSGFAKPHFTVFLTVNATANQSLTLNWTKYIGWDSVSGYEVYRKSGTGAFSKQISLNGQDTQYVDTALCPGIYSYYINALYQGGKYISSSNMVSDSPDYIYQQTPVLLRKATVINNDHVYINWDPLEQANFSYYTIDRYDGSAGGWQYNYAKTTNIYYDDYNTDVNRYSYKYRVKVADRCGNLGPASNIGTSILLTGLVANDTRYLYWNPYLLWTPGVNAYHLELQQMDGSFKDLSVNILFDTTYIDSLIHNETGIPTCYKVYAVENSGGPDQADTSISNKICLNLPARIFIPNAFTPNADNKNDVFKPVGLSIIENTNVSELQYDFRIYNRWGQRIFETHDINQGWDGTYRGEKLPLDVYVYTIDAHGYTAERFYIRGQVTLLR